ncbi:MAG: hypothetical protein KGH61_03205 [Candidatus Micrarchaeota archaeon]|nr:hypothetical protein [Candidatus Micrarchaeota archaeon]MDE1847931.1 hypothetical protein [Candidatus Micrarchaeota archaeon]MDE1864931.1 hypothetical protein [Candidatus Micrarchaeota archaeon]
MPKIVPKTDRILHKILNENKVSNFFVVIYNVLLLSLVLAAVTKIGVVQYLDAALVEVAIIVSLGIYMLYFFGQHKDMLGEE